MMIGRRTFLTGLVAAPIVVRSGLVMPIKELEVPEIEWAVRIINIVKTWPSTTKTFGPLDMIVFG